MLSGIFSALGGKFLDDFFTNAAGLATAYINKQITRDELDAQLRQAFFGMLAQVESAYADSISKTYASFMQALAHSAVVQAVWAFVVVSETLVLLWHQVGIPAIVALGLVTRYPSSGTTVDWAYLLVTGCVGFGAVTLRGGGSGATTLDAFKGLAGKVFGK